MMSDLAQRLESALTRASATLLSAHAHLCLAAAARLSSRLPAARAVALYCRAHDLSQVDERWIRMQVLARMGAIWPSPGRTIAPGAGRIERIRHTMRQWVRVRFAPFGDPALQELLEFEFAHARVVILELHVRSAIRLASIVGREVSAPAAVALYLDRMRVRNDVSGAEYAVAVSRLGRDRRSEVLPPAGNGIGHAPKVAHDSIPNTTHSGADRRTSLHAGPRAIAAWRKLLHRQELVMKTAVELKH
jgi:hypothetical protein